MNIFSAFDTGVMVALLLGIEFLRSDIQTILYCKRNDPGIFKSCLYTLFILLASLYSIVAGAMLNPEPVPVYELMPGFQIGVYGSCFLFIFLVIAGLISQNPVERLFYTLDSRYRCLARTSLKS